MFQSLINGGKKKILLESMVGLSILLLILLSSMHGEKMVNSTSQCRIYLDIVE